MQRRDPLHFDGWTLDPVAGELSRGDLRVRLQRQPQLILEELLARPGEVVTRAALTERLWPKAIVEFDMALNSAVRRLRKALRDDPERPRYIETVPRRGYRYVGPQPVPVPQTAEPAPAPVSTPDQPPPAARPDAGARPRRVRDPGLRAWPLIALLGLGVLGAVASRSGILPPAGIDWTAGPFDANALRAGAPQGQGRWVGNPQVAQEHAPAAAEDGARPGPLAQADDRVSSQASEQYAIARHLFRRRGPGDVEAALRAFSDVVAKEPRFAPAWAGLASATWIEMVEGRLDPVVGVDRVREAAERALALDPRLSEAHLRLAMVHRRAGDLRRADEHVRRALAAEPNDPLALMVASNHALGDGRVEEAVALYTQVVRVDPLSAAARQNLAWLLFRTGRTADAQAEAARLIELYPGHEGGTTLLCVSLVTAGRYSEALAADRRAPSVTPARAQCQALAFAGLGRWSDVQVALETLALSPDHETELQFAEFYAQTGDADRAFEWLHRAVQRDAERCERWMIQRSPLLRTLREDARWDALVAVAATSGA